jgi:hypothetical protein
MHIDFKQVCGLEEVSKLWKARMGTNYVWAYQFYREKYPLVEGKRRFKDDFIVLHPIAVSARRMSCLGEFVGLVPKISEKNFNRLSQVDPFKVPWNPNGDAESLNAIGHLSIVELPKTLRKKRFVSLSEAAHAIQTPTLRTASKIKDSFQMIVEPQFFKRLYEKNLVDDLVKYGDFERGKAQSSAQKGVMVPYTLKNVIVLANHPLKHHPDFHGVRICVNETWMDEDSKGMRKFFINRNAVFDRCNVLAEKVNIYFTREKATFEIRNLTYYSKLTLVKKHNCQITPLRVRAFFNLIEKIETGAWPDDLWENGAQEIHTAETFRVYDEQERITLCECPAIMTFDEERMDIDPDPLDNNVIYGMAPGFPAEEVRQPPFFIQYPGQRPSLIQNQ